MVLDELMHLVQSLFQRIYHANPPPQIDKYAVSDFVRFARGEAGGVLTLKKGNSSLMALQSGGQPFGVRSKHL